MRSVLSFVTRVVAYLVILGALAAITLAVLVPRVVGATPYTILTGSMAPKYPAGTLMVVKPVETKDIAVGDVVMVQLRTGEAAYVTHRVVAIRQGLDETTSFETKGDANASPDVEYRRAEQIRGKLWYSVPFLGRANTMMTQAQHQNGVYAVAAGLVVYAGYMFVSAARQRRREACTPARHRELEMHR